MKKEYSSTTAGGRAFSAEILRLIDESATEEITSLEDLNRVLEHQDCSIPANVIAVAKFMIKIGWQDKMKLFALADRINAKIALLPSETEYGGEALNRAMNDVKEDILLEAEIREKYLGVVNGEAIKAHFNYPSGYGCSEVADDVFEQYSSQSPLMYKFRVKDKVPFGIIMYGEVNRQNEHHIVTVVNKKVYDRFMAVEPVRWRKYVRILNSINPGVVFDVEQGSPKL
ncbi:MAG: hypothetical protein LRZ99_02975 [Desulfotomaculum sp.]|nr:hypothetical protein [Desulfotomaculum sp.]